MPSATGLWCLALVILVGIQPTTCGLELRCSMPLSYRIEWRIGRGSNSQLPEQGATRFRDEVTRQPCRPTIVFFTSAGVNRVPGLASDH